MALNQIPYTNVHELNLNWILSKLQEFENRLEDIEDYGDEITDLYSKIEELKSAVLRLKNSYTALNVRCTKLEDDLDHTNLSMHQIYSNITAEIANIVNLYDALNGAIEGLRAYNDTSNEVVLQKAKQYTRDRIADLLNWLEDPAQVYVFNPWTGQMETIQQLINYLYDLLHFAGLTAADFDAMGLTAADFDALGLTAEEFDNYGRWEIFFNRNYVTSESLEEILTEYAKLSDLTDYAKLTDLSDFVNQDKIKIFDPTNGILGSIQNAIDHLADLHRSGLTCTQFDNADLTCSEFEALDLTAFDFDFIGLLRFIASSIISISTGITAEQYQNILVGAGGQLYTII